jgi:hypothetical protein
MRWEQQVRKDITQKEGRKEGGKLEETEKEELWEDRDRWKGNPHKVEMSQEEE